ncbi:MAG: YhbY family RNA-binding protein, partial [Firmicutes bacterium]|nr:YhbY family RNA-binding protein [Bacillota bacterium]
LTAHELVKVKVQEGAEVQPKEAANVTAVKLNTEYVQSMGRRFVLYRASKERRITLPR